MASGIAHDLNNPLQVISLSTQLLCTIMSETNTDGDEDMEQVSQLAKDISRAAQTIEKLTSTLHDFSQQSPETHAAVDLRRVVENALSNTQHRLNKAEVTVVGDLGEMPARVSGSEVQLEQVLVNLITNACEAMAEQEGARKLTLRIEPQTVSGQSFWACQVSDTGCGIPEEAQANLFKSFFTTKEDGRGRGLGLTICRGILSRHGGSIKVASAPRAGTTFTVLLPAAESPQSR